MLRVLPIVAILLSLAALALTALFVGGPAGWSRTVTSDPQTEAVTYDFRLRALDDDSELAVRCRPDEPVAVLLVADAPLGPAALRPLPRPARLSLDGEPASVREVAITNRTVVLTHGAPDAARALVTRLAESRQLDVILDAGADGHGLTASFATVGADDVVAELRQTCPRKLSGATRRDR